MTSVRHSAPNLPPELHISAITHQDLPELLRLHAQYLNYGEGIQSHFAAVLDDPHTVAVKATAHGRMVGLDIYTRGIALSGGHEALCDEIRALAGDATVYTGDALLVVPEWRGRGVDAEMLRECRAQLLTRGAAYVLYELWVHPDGRVPAHRTVERYARVIDLGLKPDFYVDFDHYGYLCPLCGEKCRCAAHLYLCRL